MAENKPKNDEMATRINQAGPCHTGQDCDEAAHGKYDARLPGDGMDGRDSRKAAPKPY